MQAKEEPFDSKPTDTAIYTAVPQVSSTTVVAVAQPLPTPAVKEFDEEDGVEGGCFCCKSKGRKATDRLHFVRKVYMILFLQIAITTGWLVLVFAVEAIRDFVQEKWPILLAAFVLALATLLALFCVPKLHQRVPWNYLLLLLFVREM